MNKLYAYRGWILGGLAVALLLMPGAPLANEWCGEALPLSIAIFIVFVLLRILARRTIGEHTRGFTHDADRLVTESLYSRIRHPLYLSNAGIGYALIILHLGFSLMALPFVVILFSFEFLLSRMEDRYLENRFGDEWRKWAMVTPAFFPRLALGNMTAGRLHPEMENGKPAERSFLSAARGDVSTWFWLAVAIALIVLRKTVLNFNFLELIG